MGHQHAGGLVATDGGKWPIRWKLPWYTGNVFPEIKVLFFAGGHCLQGLGNTCVLKDL